MAVLWLAALSRLTANSNLILDLRRKIRDQIAAVATWDPGSSVLSKYNPSVQGNTRVAWTGTIPFKDIPDTDVLVYFVNKADSRLQKSAPSDANGFTQTSDDSSWSEVFIERIDRRFSLFLFSPTLTKIDSAAAYLGATALHEAMHNKIDLAKPAGFDLHKSGGFGVASAKLEDSVEATDLTTTNPKFSIKVTSTNRELWRKHFGRSTAPQMTRKDFKTENFMFR